MEIGCSNCLDLTCYAGAKPLFNCSDCCVFSVNFLNARGARVANVLKYIFLYYKFNFHSTFAYFQQFSKLAIMNATIQINSRGTLTIPKALRKTLGLDKGGTLYAENTRGGIVLRPTVTFPIEIYTDDRVKEFDESESELESLLRKKRKLE